MPRGELVASVENVENMETVGNEGNVSARSVMLSMAYWDLRTLPRLSHTSTHKTLKRSLGNMGLPATGTCKEPWYTGIGFSGCGSRRDGGRLGVRR